MGQRCRGFLSKGLTLIFILSLLAKAWPSYAQDQPMDPQDQKSKENLAQAHYNMGNTYFKRGEYQRAAAEYDQAVVLTPDDADTHYNLAFVSSDYLGDWETALEHYQWYLYLKPDVPDAAVVKEKILQAKSRLRSKGGSS